MVIHVFVYNQCISQPAIQWQKCYGSSKTEQSRDIKLTTDGGYILLGHTNNGNDYDVSGNHGADYWVVKLDSAGTMQWQKCLGGSIQDIGYAVQQTSDGGYIVCGYARSTDGDVTGLHDSLANGYPDAWVVKLDAAGGIQWQHCYGGSYGEVAYDIVQTTDGSYVFVGAAGSNDNDVNGNHGGYSDVWLVKINNTGAMQWQRCLGGTSNEVGYSIKQTADGGVVFAGVTYSNDGDVTGYHPSPGAQGDAWVVKTDSAGNIQWQKCFGGSKDDGASAIIQTIDGGYLFGGAANSTDGDVAGLHPSILDYPDAWVVKLDGFGNLQWQHCYGGSDADVFYSVNQTMDGGYILGGQTESMDGDVTGNHYYDLWLVKIDTSSAIMWQKCLGGSSLERTGIVRQTPDSGFIITGSTLSNNGDVSGLHDPGAGFSDCWVVKLGPDTILGISDIINEMVSISINPNPAKEYFKVRSQLMPKQKAWFVLMDFFGRTIMEAELNSVTTELMVQTDNFADGLYLWSLLLGDKKVQTGRIAVIR
jgi:hypothetical protein